MRTAIIEGRLKPNDHITEAILTGQLGVSRTPVREALRKLHAEGLLEFVPHQGAIVTEWTSEDRDDLFELRALLESYGAARAARRITPAGIAELRQLAEDQYHETLSKTPGYLERIGNLNSHFHRRIHEFAGSTRLVSALSSLIEAQLMMKTFETYQDEDLIRSASHHLEIVRALEARDGDWSAALMRSHILGARGALRLL